MYVLALRVWQFRNYEQAQLEFSPQLNIFVGANAQGKTNLLEALYYLSTLRPLRPVRESDLVRWGATETRLSVRFVREELTDELQLRLPLQAKRQVWLNGEPVSRQSSLVGYLGTVCFTAQDLQIVRGEPADRRRFLDTEIALLSHRYLYSLAHYKRALEQRNNLLRAYLEGVSTLDSLPEWNAQLVKYGARLFHSRKQFLERLTHSAQGVHSALTGEQERLELLYQPGLPIGTTLLEKEEDWHEAFVQALHQAERDEVRRATTLVGPHRDDFAIQIGGYDARLFGSQGQQRTCALSLRLSEVPLFESIKGEPPVVLLDDVFSDLDPERRARLVAFLQPRAQTLITCTDLTPFSPELIAQSAIFHVSAGSVQRDERA